MTTLPPLARERDEHPHGLRPVAILFGLIAIAVAAIAAYSLARSPSSLPVALAQSSNLIAFRADGGPVVTELGYGIRVNEGSSLRRAWYWINDPDCPIEISQAGLNTTYKERSYRYTEEGILNVREPVAAFELRYVLYDIFGRHITTISATKVNDVAAGEHSITGGGSANTWSESDIQRFLTSVVYVAAVRRADGSVWKQNYEALALKVASIEPSFEKPTEEEPDRNRKRP